MGQQSSAHSDDASCFRSCMRDKKAKTLKSPAAPINSRKQDISPIFEDPNNNKNPQESKKLPFPSKPYTFQLRDSDTSLEIRNQTETKPNTQVKGKGVGEQKQTIVKQKGFGEEASQQQVGALGLQSKFSSSYKSKTKVFGKRCRVSEGGVTGYPSEKQLGSSEETTSKSHQTQNSNTRSRKILLNKIEDIKQKYYERELEIQIYQDQNQYQQQLDQLAKLEEKCKSEHSQLPLASVREITSIKKNILAKLNQRKLIRNNNKKQPNPNPLQNGQSLLQPGEDLKCNDQLEIYSRNNIRQSEAQDQLKSSKRMTSKKEKLNKSSRSIDASQDISLQQRVQFSQYSQQDTLQEIRECDEEDQDYKSRVESKVKQVIKGIGLPSKRLTSRNSNVNCYRQGSLAINEQMSQSVKSIKVKDAQIISKSHSSKQIRASASPQSVRAGGDERIDNKILFF